MSRWFRHYAGMMRDEKLVRVAVKAKQSVERVIWVWGAILESAAEINDGGRFEFDCGECAYFLRCDADEIERIVAGLEDAGRLVSGVVARWRDRQFASDTSAERQRRYRERRRDDDKGPDVKHNSDGPVTSRDGEVTPPETEYRNREQNNTMLLNGRERELCEALGVTDETKTPGLLSLSDPLHWLASGCDLDADILPTLRQIGARGRRVTSWNYCSRAVFEARDRRLAPPPPVEARGNGPPRTNGRRRNYVDAARDLGWLNNGRESDEGNSGDAQRLPSNRG